MKRLSHPDHYGPLLRRLHSCADQSMTEALNQMELTAAQGHIMGFLARCQDPPCSRDIEEAFQLSHPTVWGLLSRLEKKGFIEFRADEHDRRCKRIYVLPKGQRCMHEMYHNMLATEERIVQGFTAEEQVQFRSFLKRAIENMGQNPEQHHKEENHPC